MPPISETATLAAPHDQRDCQRHRLQENVGAYKVELSAGEIADIATALDALSVTGDRYPPEMMKTVGR